MSSQEQTKLLQELKKIAPNLEFVEDYRPAILKNIKTGKNFEIDIYCEKLKFGFEYQGGVHFKDIKRFGNNSDNSRVNDCLKQDLIDKTNGKLVVVEIFEYDLKGDIKKNIAERVLNTAYYFRNKNNKKCNPLFSLYLAFKYSIGYGFSFGNTSLSIKGEDGCSIKYSDELREEKESLPYLHKEYKKRKITLPNGNTFKILVKNKKYKDEYTP